MMSTLNSETASKLTYMTDQFVINVKTVIYLTDLKKYALLAKTLFLTVANAKKHLSLLLITTKMLSISLFKDAQNA